MGSMTALNSNLLHDSCAVRIFVTRAYLGDFCNCGEHRGAAGSVLGTIVYGAVAGIGDGSTLGAGSVVGIGCGPTLGDGAGALVGSNVSSIYCRALMACIFSSLTTNGDAGDGLLSASDRFSTDWRAASVDEFLGLSSYAGKIHCLDYTFCTCGWDINGVASVVFQGWPQIPPFHAMLCKRASLGRIFKN